MLRAAGGGIGIANGIQVLAKSAVAVSCPADTTEDILATINIAAGAMGPNGAIRVTTQWSYTSSANGKAFRVRLGGIAGAQILNTSATTLTSSYSMTSVQNRGSESSQVAASSTIFSNSGTSITALVISAIDTSVASTLVITGQKNLAGETLTLESYLVELMYGA